MHAGDGITAASPTARLETHANRSKCSAYMDKSGANYSYVRDEHCCLTLPPSMTPDGGVPAGLVSLYLLYSADNHDHVLSANAAYAQGGHAYAHDSIECYAFATPTAHTSVLASLGMLRGVGAVVPLDVYWSSARNDSWTLASNASRAQAVALGGLCDVGACL